MSAGQYDYRYPISFQGGCRDWAWHASHVEPDRRVLMPAKLLHPDDAHVADADGIVDITALQGTAVRMRRDGVLRLLHVHFGRWDFMLAVNPLRTSEHNGKTYYHFDPATRMCDIYDAFEERLPEPGTMAEFATARAFFRYANPPADRLPPRTVLTAAARSMSHNPVRAADLRQFMMVRDNQLPRLLEVIRGEREDFEARLSSTRYEAVTEEAMAARVPFLAGLENSCFATDPEDAARFHGPDATSRSRLGRISTGFVPAAFFAYAKAPVMRHPAMLPRYLRGFDRFVTEAVAENATFRLEVTADVDRAFEHAAFGELKAISGSRGWRDRMIQDATSVLRHARRTMVAFDPEGSKGILAQTPAEQTDRDDFLKRVKEAYADDRAEYGASRAKFANKVKNGYDRVVDAAAHRILQIKADGAAGRAAIDTLCLPGNQHLAYWDVHVAGPELTDKGHPTGRQQIRRYRWWRLECAWLSLLHDRHWTLEPSPELWLDMQHEAGGVPVAVRYLPDAAALSREPDFHGGDFICEHLCTTMADDGGTPSTPGLLATLAEHQFFADPGFLDVGQRELKEKLRKAWRIRPSQAQRRGLLRFDHGRAHLARAASRSDRANPRTFIPHEEAEHALRLAAHGVDAIVQTWCRLSEALQQVEYGDRWEDPAGTDAFGWLASRKMKRRDPIGTEHFLECDEDHYMESVELLGIAMRRCRLEEPEIVEPPTGICWKLDPGPFVFAFDGRALEHHVLRNFLDVLLVNVIEARFHDLRAGASNRSRRKGASFLTLGEGLGHRSSGFIELYSGLTPEQAEEQADEVRTDKIDRIEADKQRRDAA